MPRKSVSYLTSIRHEVRVSLQLLSEVARDFQIATEDMSIMSPEMIRTDTCPEYKDMLDSERALQKAIKEHKKIVKTLKAFF